MRFLVAVSVASVVAGSLVACSSDSDDKTQGGQPVGTDSGAGGGSSTGGKGNAGSSAGGKGGSSSTGGKTGAGGDGAGGTATCSPDAGPDDCRPCLTNACKTDYDACTGDATCKEKFDTYQTCVNGSCGDANVISECFSSFAGDTAAQHSTLTTCIYNNCSVECGGPIPL